MTLTPCLLPALRWQAKRVKLPKPAAVVVDIEGTTSAAGFIFDVLFPYSRERIAEWVSAHQGTAALAEVKKQTAEMLDKSEMSDFELVSALQHWIDVDLKATPLKSVQGEIWAQGFAAGDLKSHFFEDSHRQLRNWAAAGIKIYVYSSGSIQAQKSWFESAPQGSLSDIISGNFDTTNAGPKRAVDSYHSIAQSLAEAPNDLIFFSDIEAELHAAVAAGWRTVGVYRIGEPNDKPGTDAHIWVSTFDEIEFE
jgi:enolase-phosphatase E1